MISKDLVAASSKPLILSSLAKGESYGYEIIKNIQELSKNEIQGKDGMLYPVLNKLCQSGLVDSEWKVIDGRKRKYYCITKEGLNALENEKQQWYIVNTALNSAWGDELCFN